MTEVLEDERVTANIRSPLGMVEVSITVPKEYIEAALRALVDYIEPLVERVEGES